MNFEQKVALGARPLNCLSPQIMLVDDPTSNHILYRCSPEDLRLAAVLPAFSHNRQSWLAATSPLSPVALTPWSSSDSLTWADFSPSFKGLSSVGSMSYHFSTAALSMSSRSGIFRDSRADLVARGPDTHLHVCEAVRRHDLLDAAHDDHLDDLCGNQPGRRVRQFFNNAFLGDGAAVLAPSSGEERRDDSARTHKILISTP